MKGKNSMSVRYSFILPVYNVKEFVCRCVESIERQKDDNYEIIIVDDGSTDGSSDYVDEYSKKHSKIKVVHKENGGLSSARNEGMKYACGDYIIFVDPDDWITDDYLEKVGNVVQANPDADIVKFNFYRRFSNGDCVKKESNLKSGVYSREDIESVILADAICYEDFSSHNIMLLSAWSHIYSRKFLENNSLKFVSERLVGSEDWVFNISAYCLANIIVALPDCLYNYDERDGSLTQRYVVDFHEKRICLYKTVKSWLIEHNMYSELFSRRLSALYIRMFFYDVLDNECKQKKDKGEVVSAIKGFLDNPTLEECLSIYSRRVFNCKEALYLFLLKHKLAKGLYFLKNR